MVAGCLDDTVEDALKQKYPVLEILRHPKLVCFEPQIREGGSKLGVLELNRKMDTIVAKSGILEIWYKNSTQTYLKILWKEPVSLQYLSRQRRGFARKALLASNLSLKMSRDINPMRSIISF